MNGTEMDVHPAAELFPLMTGPPFEDFVGDIAINGLREPIVTCDGAILDGRNRFRACELAGVPVRFLEWDRVGTPEDFVISLNLHRRHLDESQRAMVAAKLATWRRGRPAKNGGNPPKNGLSAPAAAELFNVGTRTVEKAKVVRNKGVPELIAAVEQGALPVDVAVKIAREPEAVQPALVADADPKTAIKRHRRVAKLAAIGAKAEALPGGRRYPVILADPPWKFETYSEAGLDRSAENHYPVMALDEIKALPVGEAAADDAVLFLWVTVPFLAAGIDVLRAWGFTYKSNYVWRKDQRATGYWGWDLHEHVLIATRGDIPAPLMGTQCESVFDAPVAGHSVKPAIFHEIIEGYYPDVPRLEMFARIDKAEDARPGWDVWGNEAGKGAR